MELSSNMPIGIPRKLYLVLCYQEIHLSDYIQIMLNRLQSQEKQEQTLDKHRQITLHTTMKKVWVFLNIFRHERLGFFVCSFSPKVQEILQYFLKRSTFFTNLNHLFI